MPFRDEPPMPADTVLHATIRDPEGREVPVARVDFVDVLGERVTMDFDARRAMKLAVQLLAFVQQVGLDPGVDS